VRRSIDDAFTDLRAYLADWVRSGAEPGVRIFVYPPEWEARMLARFPSFAGDCASVCPVSLVDVGQGFLSVCDGFVEQLTVVERDRAVRPLHDLGVVARRYLEGLLAGPLEEPLRARLLVNLGALATLVSYSTIANALNDGGSDGALAAPTVLAFPGEGDDRSLNLMRLRADTNYRVPRI
jgi:hypothetical protein